MSFAQPACFSTGSTDRPMIFTPRRSNSDLIFAMYPSSVVHTGVKSFGCENKTAQELPTQSWKLIFPSVVSAWKSGAVSPIFIRFLLLFFVSDNSFQVTPKVNIPLPCPLRNESIWQSKTAPRAIISHFQ